MRSAKCAAPNAVVDVHHRKSGRAARERGLERHPAARGNAIADRTRNRHHGARHEAGEHAEQRAFHARHRDDHAMAPDLVQPFHEAPEPGDADIDEQRGGLAGEGERARRFGAHAQVRSARADDRDATAMARRRHCAHDGGPRNGVVVECVAQRRRHPAHLPRPQAREQQPLVEFPRMRDDRFDLRDGLGFAQHRFGGAGARVPLPVEAELRHGRPAGTRRRARTRARRRTSGPRGRTRRVRCRAPGRPAPASLAVSSSITIPPCVTRQRTTASVPRRSARRVSTASTNARSSAAIAMPVSTRLARQGCAGSRSRSDRSSAWASAYTSALPMPASTYGWTTRCSSAARSPGR